LVVLGQVSNASTPRNVWTWFPGRVHFLDLTGALSLRYYFQGTSVGPDPTDFHTDDVSFAYCTPASTDPGPGLRVIPSRGPAGTTFRFDGLGFTPGGQIRRWFVEPDGTRHDLETLTADGAGRFQRLLTIGIGAPPGTYTYYARDLATDVATWVRFTVTGGTGLNELEFDELPARPGTEERRIEVRPPGE
jgi:hypothetical protein